MSKKRYDVRALRAEELTTAALRIARTKGYRTVSAQDVAVAAGVSRGLVYNFFPNEPALHNAIIHAAVCRADIEVLLQGLVVGDPVALGAPPDLKERAKAVLNHER